MGSPKSHISGAGNLAGRQKKMSHFYPSGYSHDGQKWLNLVIKRGNELRIKCR